MASKDDFLLEIAKYENIYRAYLQGLPRTELNAAGRRFFTWRRNKNLLEDDKLRWVSIDVRIETWTHDNAVKKIMTCVMSYLDSELKEWSHVSDTEPNVDVKQLVAKRLKEIEAVLNP